MRIFFYFLIFISSINSGYASNNNVLKVLSTTSTRDSGFYNYLLPKFEEQHKVKVYVIATGTGQAIKNAQNCNGDILITHAPDLEKEFVKNKFGVSRHNLMYNDFVLIGPKTQLRELQKLTNITDVFSYLAFNKIKFISRGDNSGTNISEHKIWNLSNINIKNHSGDWYLETGQGMGATLNIAVATNSYVYSDRATWLKFKNKQNHMIVYENDHLMFNQYSIVQINPKYCTMINNKLADTFFKWITSKDVQQLIKNYKLDGKSLFVPNFQNE